MTPERREPPFAAVLLDMDGLLFDSERLALAVIERLSGEIGTPVPREVILRTVGCNRQLSREIYLEYDPRIDYDRLRDLFSAEMVRLGAQGRIPLKEGALPLLRLLKRLGIPRAVASSSPRANVGAYLRGAGIRSLVDQLVCGDEITRSKPDPEAFLLAARALAVSPEACLVLEDSLNGIRAGHAAGCTVCMIPDLFPWEEALSAFADLHFSSLNGVLPLFAPSRETPSPADERKEGGK